jgi:hypothetical protein
VGAPDQGGVMQISRPGIYLDVAANDYHADLAPVPSLTQSIAKILLDRSPLHAWHAHPRLNPNYRHDDDTKFDVGNVTHKMLLGRGKDIEVLDFNDWRTNAAKERRDEAIASGKIAVLGKTMAKADRMVRAAREQLEPFGLAEFDGDSEVVIAWEENGIWARSMIDRLATSRKLVLDYKTTDMSCAPEGMARMMISAGWHIQAAMHQRGLDVLSPKTSGRRLHLFVAQETEYPHCLTVVEIPKEALVIGGKMIEAAFTQWRRCMKADRWPGYPPEVVKPELPGWAEQQWLDREIKDAARERLPEDGMMAG